MAKSVQDIFNEVYGSTNRSVQEILNEVYAAGVGKQLAEPSDIWDYPHIGAMKSIPAVSAIPTNNAAVYLGAGESGVIRELMLCPMTVTGLNWTDLPNYEVRVYYDLGDLTEAERIDLDALAPHLSLRIPLCDLFGANFHAAPSGNAMEVHSRWMNAVWSYGTIGVMEAAGSAQMTSNYPMPYSNGILIQVCFYTGSAWEVVKGDENKPMIFVSGFYEDGALPAGDIGTWRLRGGLVGQSYCNVTTSATVNGVFLNTDQAGIAFGMFGGWKSNGADPADWTHCEGNPTYDIDGVAAHIEYSGHEENNINTGPYYVNLADDTYVNRWDSGGRKKEATKIYEQFRWYMNFPNSWESSAVGYIPFTDGAAEDDKICFLHYGPVPTVTEATTTVAGVELEAANTHYFLTSSVNTKKAILPPPVVGTKMWLQVGANGYSIVAQDDTAESINGNTPTAGHKLTVGANTVVLAECTAENTWVCQVFAADGTFTAPAAA